ncbi:MAG: hypothetical protein R2855_16305 [Thermomicrobiales bacterium]
MPRYLDEVAAMTAGRPGARLVGHSAPLSKTGLAITAGFAFTAAWFEVLLVIIMITQQDKATLPLQFFFAADGGRNAEVTAALWRALSHAGADSFLIPPLDGAQPDYVHPRALMARFPSMHWFRDFAAQFWCVDSGGLSWTIAHSMRSCGSFGTRGDLAAQPLAAESPSAATRAWQWKLRRFRRYAGAE